MKHKSVITAVLGLGLMAAGLYAMKHLSGQGEWILALCSFCTALGCGFFGQGAGSLVTARVMSGHSQEKKRLEIEQRDERNIAVNARAKSSAWDVMTFVFGALMVSFALMNVGPVPIVMLVAAYLFVECTAIYYRSRYEKEM